MGNALVFRLQKGRNPEKNISNEISFPWVYFSFSVGVLFTFTKPRHFAQKAIEMDWFASMLSKYGNLNQQFFFLNSHRYNAEA